MVLTGRQSIGGGSLATQSQPSPGKNDATGASAVPAEWRPRTRQLSDELAQFFAAWPPAAGRIARVLYSPPDWDDRPRAVAIPGRKAVKTGNFPHDDTHQIVVTTLDGRRHTIAVIPPQTDAAAASARLSPGRPDQEPEESLVRIAEP